MYSPQHRAVLPGRAQTGKAKLQNTLRGMI